MNEINIYIYNDVSLNIGIVEAREWLDKEIHDKALSSLMLTVFAELAQNIIKYANRGKITLKIYINANKRSLEISSIDQGPGIACLQTALEDGFSTSGTLGLGLPGIKRIMDEFEINSEPEKGTEFRGVKKLWM
jgi:serine/threonine-protein kinase RsbT